MASMTIGLRNQTNQDGRYSVLIRFRIGRKQYNKVLFKIEPSKWDKRRNRVKKTHPLNDFTNKLIVDNLHDGEKYILHCESIGAMPTADAFFQGAIRSITLSQSFVTIENEFIQIGGVGPAKKYKSTRLKIERRRCGDWSAHIEIA